jgi:sugar lactone lactonase YvrE
MQNGMTVAGGNGRGDGLNQFHCPWGLYVDSDQTIYIADCMNNRVVQWKYGATNGQVVAGGYGKENQTNQLSGPKDVLVDKRNGCLIICDTGNERLVRWSRRNKTHGETIISNIKCYGLKMDNEGYLYVSDYGKHEVRRWRVGDSNGTVVAGGNGQGNNLKQLNCPTYIFLDQDHSVYVSDPKNHRVM